MFSYTRIKEIAIKRPNKEPFEQRISFNDRRLVIVHGPNNCGKSQFLRITNAYVNGYLDVTSPVANELGSISVETYASDNSNDSQFSVNEPVSCLVVENGIGGRLLGNDFRAGFSTSKGSRYLSDCSKYCSRATDLQRDLFLELVNPKLKDKQIKLNSNKEFELYSADDEIYPLGYLSDGETELILLYSNLLFTTLPNELILLDNIGIYCHIAWQRQLIDDLLKIREMNDLDIILVTHSPDVITHHHELMVDFSNHQEN